METKIYFNLAKKIAETFEWQIEKSPTRMLDGIVGRVVASGSKGPEFESC